MEKRTWREALRTPAGLLAVYGGIWLFALVVFLVMDPTDAMAYEI